MGKKAVKRSVKKPSQKKVALKPAPAMPTVVAARRNRVHHVMPEHSEEQIARAFVSAVRSDLSSFVCAGVLFGSCATSHATSLSDIDVLLIIDDVSNVIDTEVTESYQLVVRGHAMKTSPRLHVNTLKLSSFWEYCREGDPVVVNMLRDGHVLYDSGFFTPAQLLLQQGRIRPTKEAVWTYYSRSGTTMRSARKHILSACVDLYWAAMDASHAALMSVGEVPPSPEHVADLLERKLVARKLLSSQYPKLMAELYHMQKAISHREIKEISGEQYEVYWSETLRLVDALRTVVERNPPTP